MINPFDRLKSKSSWVSVVLILVGVGILIAAISFLIRWNKQIAQEREDLALAARVEVQESVLRAPSTDGITLFLHSADVRGTASLHGIRYFATSGGLIALDSGGSVKRRYTTLDGLTDNDLTTLAVFHNRLYIGTATAGMMAFDGITFTGFRFVKPRASRVSVLVPTETELLIGTLDAGLFEYDGERFSRRLNTVAGADFDKVTALLSSNSRLYIGTQDKGLYLWREAQLHHFSTPEGLPAARVTGLSPLPASEEIAIATDFGVVTLNEANAIRLLSKQPNITSLAVSRGRLYAGLFSGGLVEVKQDSENPLSYISISDRSASPETRPATLTVAEEGRLWALTSDGAFARDEEGNSPAFEPVFHTPQSDRILTASHITSLAVDTQKRLWVGYFDCGLDLLSLETVERLVHLEDERLREINFIAVDEAQDRSLVATSRGLVTLDSHLKQSVQTREQGGLIDNAIAHISFVEDVRSVLGKRIVVATAGGLTDYAQGRARSITAFHGLSSNHLYTSASVGSRLFVGSLAGVAELEGLRVIRIYKKSNSNLSEDWVTALGEAEGVLYIGTIGGVNALLPTGEMINFTDEIGSPEVNLNAMRVDGENLYIGTSDKGVLAYNVRERKWSRLSVGLPSPNVTAIASDDRFLYVGTLNGLARVEKRVLE